MNHRDETKAADALAKATSYRGYQPQAFVIRMCEFPAFIQREIFALFLTWVKTMAVESNDEYHNWPEDIASEARIIWERSKDLYEGS